MHAAFAPRAVIQSRTFRAMRSGQLSHQVYSGGPHGMNGFVSASRTTVELGLRPTRIISTPEVFASLDHCPQTTVHRT